MLYFRPDRSLPKITLPVWGLFFFLSTNQKIELIDSPRGDYMATYRWQGAKMNLGLEIEDACDETMRGFRKRQND